MYDEELQKRGCRKEEVAVYEIEKSGIRL